MARLDPHSYYDSEQPRVERLSLIARIDFDRRILDGTATLHFAPGAHGGTIDLDTRDLTILKVTAGDAAIAHQLSEKDPILGTRLRVQAPASANSITIEYRTSPESTALQWLTAEQTFGGEHPFLFSQCQAIHARSVVPLQDTPRARLRYDATITVPAHLKVLMAAAQLGEEMRGSEKISRFEMNQPIPPYLLAFAVGDLVSRELGPRSRVWAEPKVADKAAWEFADVDTMLTIGEKLFGEYPWERFDVLVMPRSFPYGGMENPRLTFVTPTLLAGDRSLTNVIAHELAHSWTGNLITNADAEHFWLNEGWTVFAERRILEALSPPHGGKEASAIDAALGRRTLERAVTGQFKDHPELTCLRTHLTGVDPDEAFSEVPYEKGYLFLRTIEEAVGRTRFDALIHAYVDRFRFGTITTEEFCAFMERELPGVLMQIHSARFLDQPGIPDNAPRAESSRIDAVESTVGKLPGATASGWTPAEWQLYLEQSVDRATPELCRALDEKYALTQSGNYEILVSWLELALRAGHAPAVARTEEVLAQVGRMKYLKPLYQALHVRSPERARALFARLRGGYHPIAQVVLEKALA